MTQINPSVLIRNEGAEPIELHFRSQTVPLASQAAYTTTVGEDSPGSGYVQNG